MTKTFFCMLLSMFILSCAATSIQDAVKRNDLEQVKSYVAKGDLNSTDLDERKMGRWKSDISLYTGHKDGTGYTALMVASYSGHTEIARYLCEQGADLDRKSASGQTALIFAAYYGHTRIVEILLAHGVSVNLKDKFGHTARYYAEMYNYDTMAKMLEQAGADFN